MERLAEVALLLLRLADALQADLPPALLPRLVEVLLAVGTLLPLVGVRLYQVVAEDSKSLLPLFLGVDSTKSPHLPFPEVVLTKLPLPVFLAVDLIKPPLLPCQAEDSTKPLLLFRVEDSTELPLPRSQVVGLMAEVHLQWEEAEDLKLPHPQYLDAVPLYLSLFLFFCITFLSPASLVLILLRLEVLLVPLVAAPLELRLVVLPVELIALSHLYSSFLFLFSSRLYPSFYPSLLHLFPSYFQVPGGPPAKQHDSDDEVEIDDEDHSLHGGYALSSSSLHPRPSHFPPFFTQIRYSWASVGSRVDNSGYSFNAADIKAVRSLPARPFPHSRGEIWTEEDRHCRSKS